jgi:hypothetical protein
MLDRVLIDNIGLTLVVWIALYVSDYYTTLSAARLYRAGADRFMVFEGSFELTPAFQHDVDHLRQLSPRFLMFLALSIAGIVAVWFLSVQFLRMSGFFAFMMGGLILREAVIHMRHVRNLALFHHANDHLKGRLEYSRWLLLRQSAVELLSFSALFLLIWLLVGSLFVLGGAFACMATGIQHWNMARKFARQAKPA